MVSIIGASSRIGSAALSLHLLGTPSLQAHCVRHRLHHSRHQKYRTNSTNADDAEPNWDEEMSIFKKRTLKPSQMEALRKLEEEKVDVGRVGNEERQILDSNTTNRFFFQFPSLPTFSL